MNTNGFNVVSAFVALPALLLTLFTGCLAAGSGGCALAKAIESTAAFQQTLAATGREMATMVKDQGVLDKFFVNAEGEWIEPGIEASSGILAVHRIRLIGVSGTMGADVKGTGTQLPKDVRAALIEQLGGPLSDEQRANILGILGWNRVESPHNPVPTP